MPAKKSTRTPTQKGTKKSSRRPYWQIVRILEEDEEKYRIDWQPSWILKKDIQVTDVEQWDGEAQRSRAGSKKKKPGYKVRRILDESNDDFLVDWAPTWEWKEHANDLVIEQWQHEKDIPAHDLEKMSKQENEERILAAQQNIFDDVDYEKGSDVEIVEVESHQAGTRGNEVDEETTNEASEKTISQLRAVSATNSAYLHPTMERGWNWKRSTRRIANETAAYTKRRKMQE